jgi:hypothetical protein
MPRIENVTHSAAGTAPAAQARRAPRSGRAAPRACSGASFTPHQLGKVLPRSSGAVANAMGKLVSLGVAELATCVLIHADTRHSCYTA